MVQTNGLQNAQVYTEDTLNLQKTSNLVHAYNLKMPKYTFPDFIRHVGSESHEMVSVTLLLILGTEGTGLEVTFGFACTLVFAGEVLDGVGGEVLQCFGGEFPSIVDSFFVSLGVCFFTTEEPF